MKTKLMTALLATLLSVFTASCTGKPASVDTRPSMPSYLTTLPDDPTPPADIDNLMESDMLQHTAELVQSLQVCRARHAAVVNYCSAGDVREMVQSR